jgi:hypothetical protein
MLVSPHQNAGQIMTQRQLTDPLTTWQSSILGGDFFLLVCCLKTQKMITYNTIIFRVILYGCETWSLTLREENRLEVFENRVLRRISRPKSGRKIIGDWRKPHNELHKFYSSPNTIRMIKSRRMRWAGHLERIRKSEIYI